MLSLENGLWVLPEGMGGFSCLALEGKVVGVVLATWGHFSQRPECCLPTNRVPPTGEPPSWVSRRRQSQEWPWEAVVTLADGERRMGKAFDFWELLEGKIHTCLDHSCHQIRTPNRFGVISNNNHSDSGCNIYHHPFWVHLLDARCSELTAMVSFCSHDTVFLNRWRDWSQTAEAVAEPRMEPKRWFTSHRLPSLCSFPIAVLHQPHYRLVYPGTGWGGAGLEAQRRSKPPRWGWETSQRLGWMLVFKAGFASWSCPFLSPPAECSLVSFWKVHSDKKGVNPIT